MCDVGDWARDAVPGVSSYGGRSGVGVKLKWFRPKDRLAARTCLRRGPRRELSGESLTGSEKKKPLVPLVVLAPSSSRLSSIASSSSYSYSSSSEPRSSSSS